MFNQIATDELEKFIHKKNMDRINQSDQFLLHKVIEEFLRLHNMSLRELSAVAEIPYSTIYSWSLGGKPKDIAKLKQLANAMNLSLDHLIFKKDYEDEDSNKVIKMKVELIIRRDGAC